MAKSTMICPKCGNEMNHHADRLIYSSEGREAANFDASPGRFGRGNPRLPRLRRRRLANRRIANYRGNLTFLAAHLTS